MPFLVRLKIRTKILAIVLFMAALTVGPSWFAVNSPATLAAGAKEVELALKRRLIGARAKVDVAGLDLAKFPLAIEPTERNIGQVGKSVAAQRKLPEDAIDATGSTGVEQAKSMIPDVRNDDEMGIDATTIRRAESSKDVRLDEEPTRRRNAADKDLDAAEKRRDRIGAARLLVRAQEFSGGTSDQCLFTSWVMLITLLLGVGLSLMAGTTIACAGSVRPMTELVSDDGKAVRG